MEFEELERVCDWEERDESIPYLNHIIAGSIAGFAEHCLMLPVDTLKTRIQADQHSRQGLFPLVRSIFRTQGWSGFWQGVPAVALGCIPAHAAMFTVYEIGKKQMNLDDGKVHTLLSSLVGGFATIFHDLIYTPFDVVKQRQQLLKNNQGTLKTLANVVRNEGIISLFRSVPVTVLMNIPNAAVMVGMNETLKVLYKPENGGHNFFSYFMCAGLAGAMAAFATIPMDVIKTKLQTQAICDEICCPSTLNGTQSPVTGNTNPIPPTTSTSSSLGHGHQEVNNTNSSSLVTKFKRTLASINTVKANHQVKYQNVACTIKLIMMEEGLRGFFRGVVPRMITQAPSSAISWATYESIKGLLAKVGPNKPKF
jgi:solute carrier family 25 iron transporter 28/37